MEGFLLNSNWRLNFTLTLSCNHRDVFESHVIESSVGLITIDEVVLAGGLGGTNNTNYYLYTNQNYWAISPAYFTDVEGANMFGVGINGDVGSTYVNNYSLGIRPVINLKSSVTISEGNGTNDNPYVVET